MIWSLDWALRSVSVFFFHKYSSPHSQKKDAPGYLANTAQGDLIILGDDAVYQLVKMGKVRHYRHGHHQLTTNRVSCALKYKFMHQKKSNLRRKVSGGAS